MSATSSTSTLYESETLVARARGGFSSRLCVITFEALYDGKRLPDQPAFGEVVLNDAGIDAIQIVPVGNDWYQYPDLATMCAAVRAVTARYDRVIAYGSSMGGYAAIRYGRWLSAEIALALSPQFSIRPWRRPFERRWWSYARKIRFRHESARDAVPTAIIAYDPMGKDAAHAARFGSITRVVPLPMPYSGHACTRFLAEIGLLRPLLEQVAQGSFSAPAFLAAVEASCGKSVQFRLERIERTADRETRHRLLQEVVATNPGSAAALRALAGSALARREIDAAIAALQAAVEIEPNHPPNSEMLSRAYRAAGRIDAAIDVLERLVANTPGSPVYAARLQAAYRHRARRIMLARFLPSLT